MRRSCRYDWRLGLGVLLTLLAYGPVAPQAHAGCADPTIVVWPEGSPSHRFHADSMSHSLPHSSVPGPRPCSGPHCSRSPMTPPVAPVTAIVSNSEWACLLVLPQNATPQGFTHRLEDDPHEPIFSTFRIYHPPR